MRLRLDETLPHDRRHVIVGHEVLTVAYVGWTGLQNGRLLAKAAEAGFDALVTKDTALPWQQNQATLPVSVVVLDAPTNDLADIRPLVPALLRVLATLAPRTVVRVSAPGTAA